MGQRQRNQQPAAASAPAHSSNPRAGWRWLQGAAGLTLLLLAAVANYSSDWLHALRGRVYLRAPGMPPGDYIFFPLWIAIGAALIAALLSIFGSARRRQQLSRAWRRTETRLALTIIVLLLGFSLWPWPSTDIAGGDTGSATVFYIVLTGAGFLLFVSAAWPGLRGLDRPAERLWQWLSALSPRRFALLLFLFTLLVTNLVSLLVFQHMPHVQDSIAQLFQARIFAAGRLWLPSMPFPDFFDYTHIINISGQTGHPASGFAVPGWPGPAGRWYSQYPFLHPLLLALGVLIGMPWLINPLLGAIIVPVIYQLGRELYDERTGRTAGLLAAVSPFLFNMAAEFMNHTSALLFAALFLLFFARAAGLTTRPAGRIRDAALAGLMLGLVVNIRPYTAAALALPPAVYGLVLLLRQPRRFAAPFVFTIIATAAVSALLLVYNWLTNGHPLLFGYVVKWGAAHEIGFGRAGWGESHTPLRGLYNTGNDWNMLNQALFEWPLPGLIIIALPFALPVSDRRDRLLLATFFCLSAAYFFYWYHGSVFGPRFLFESAAALLLLAARGLQSIGRLARETLGRSDFTDQRAGRLLSRTLPLCLGWMLAVGLPPLFARYWSYNNVDSRVIRNVRRAGLSNALVFCANLGNGFNFNSLDLSSSVVFAKDYGMLNSALTVRYPGRSCWYANKDTLTALGDISYEHSQLRQTLDEIAEGLDTTLLGGYRTIIWPFIDLPPATLDSATVSAKVTDFRIVSRELFTGRRRFDDYLPALACWILRDKREHLGIFAYMDELQNFIAADYKFTLLYVASKGTAAVYDIRPATGSEQRIEENPPGRQ